MCCNLFKQIFIENNYKITNIKLLKDIKCNYLSLRSYLMLT